MKTLIPLALTTFLIACSGSGNFDSEDRILHYINMIEGCSPSEEELKNWHSGQSEELCPLPMNDTQNYFTPGHILLDQAIGNNEYQYRQQIHEPMIYEFSVDIESTLNHELGVYEVWLPNHPPLDRGDVSLAVSINFYGPRLTSGGLEPSGSWMVGENDGYMPTLGSFGAKQDQQLHN